MTNRNTNIPKANIVIGDDTSDTVRLLMGMFAEHGYDVRAASDGAFGLESARVTPPDLILRDIRMPGMDGYAICKELKADEYTRDTPVIFISALDDVTDNEIFIGTHMTERPYGSLRTPRNDTRFSKNGTL